ncbi:methylated-DNA--[protein]-cysteine S-methyltransferase [Acidisoma sp.]|uniref:methylated-DNA--[protein]-cysteine S-methyltransferase n=1 Tax=Acidisoma sp. TaxID=1872115 RepID=UPI003B00BEBA
MPQLSLHTPIGPITVSAEADSIVAVDWGWGRDQDPVPLLLCAKAWLHAYFDGEMEPMTLPLALLGTVYRRRIWSVVGGIAPGETLSYQAVALIAGGSPRSVGGAMAANPVPILIPCHRVVGTGPRGGSAIGGYSGGEGVETKNFLLDLERRATVRRPGVSKEGSSLEIVSCRNRTNGTTR